jgi:hypothetical protein
VKYPRHNFPVPNGMMAFQTDETKEDLNYGVEISTLIEMFEQDEL